MGTPCIMVCDESYELTQWWAVQDNGFTRARRAVIDRQTFAQIGAYTVSSTGGASTPGATFNVFNAFQTAAGIPQYNAFDGIFTGPEMLIPVRRQVWDYMMNAFKWPSASPAINLREPGGNRLNMDDDIYLAAKKSLLDQTLWGILQEEPEEYREENHSWYLNPEKQYTMGGNKYLQAKGATYEEALRDFQRQAREMRFGDGLSMVIPTPELVDEMLTGTDRDRNDVLGKLKMRGGTITV